MRRGLFRWVAVAALAAALAGGSYWAWRSDSSAGLGLLWTVIPGCLALAPVVAWALRTRTPLPIPARRERLREALEELATASATRGRVDEASRGTLDPWPLPVRWAATARAQAVMVEWSSVRGTPGQDTPIPLSGHYSEIADVFTQPESPRRLVL